MLQTVSIIVSGKVQGVFYRQSTKEKAHELNLTGIVRNLPNGNVEIIATGDAEHIKTLSQWCWQGPRRAIVTDVQEEPRALQRFDDFRIEH